jgi:hypothetical protein
MTRFFLIITPLLILFACNESNDALDKDFAIAYAELRIVEREYGETEDGKAVCFQILQKHDMDVNVFEEKVNKIKNKPEKWLEFQNMFIVILDSIANDINTESDSITKNAEMKEET